MKIVPLLVEHLAALEGKPLLRTIRGIAVVEGAQALGIAGYFLCEGEMMVAMRVGKEGRALMRCVGGQRWLIRAGRQIVALAARHGLPLIAVADSSVEGAPRLLEHLGFRHDHKDIYRWQTSAS